MEYIFKLFTNNITERIDKTLKGDKKKIKYSGKQLKSRIKSNYGVSFGHSCHVFVASQM